MNDSITFPDEEKRMALRRMQRLATGCVLGALLLRVGASFFGETTWVGFLKAFAEASVVGGLADWFAVTALFRHPFGIPIPHTRILPRGKKRLANSLADFVTGNFLTKESVEREFQKMDVGQILSQFLAEKGAMLSEYFVEFIPRFLDALDDKNISTFLEKHLLNKLKTFDAGNITSRALQILTDDGKSGKITTELLSALESGLRGNKDLLVNLVRKELPIPDRIALPGFPIELPLGTMKDTLAGMIGEAGVKRLLRVLSDVRQDEEHEIRRRIRLRIEQLIADLKEDSNIRLKVENWRDELLENPHVSDYIGKVWQELKAILKQDIASSNGRIRKQIESVLKGIGLRMQEDTAFRNALNEKIKPFLTNAICGAAPACGRVIRETIDRWDAEKLAEKLELEVGRDLQFVRLNGTLVGGLLGVLLHLFLLFF